MDAPIGFRARQEGGYENLTLEMRALICRLVVAIRRRQCRPCPIIGEHPVGTHRLDPNSCRGEVPGNIGGEGQTVAGN